MARPFTPEQTRYITSPNFSVQGYYAYFPSDAERSAESILRHRRRFRDADDKQTEVTVEEGTVTVQLPADEDAWWHYLRNAEQAGARALQLSTTQQQTIWTPKEQGLPVGAAFTGDWHCGAKGVDYEALDHSLARIAATSGLYAVGMGDYHEGVSIHSKASPSLYTGVYNNGDTQDRSVRMRADVLRGKWIAFASGNHDEWVERHAGLTRCDKIARDLGCAHFGEGGGTIFLHLGLNRYAIGVRHHFGGKGATVPRRLVDEWPEWERLHVAVLAHFHFNEIQRVSRNGGRFWALRSGTFKLKDAYASQYGYVPEMGVPIAIFYPNTEKVIAFAGDDFEQAIDFLTKERERYAAS